MNYSLTLGVTQVRYHHYHNNNFHVFMKLDLFKQVNRKLTHQQSIRAVHPVCFNLVSSPAII